MTVTGTERALQERFGCGVVMTVPALVVVVSLASSPETSSLEQWVFGSIAGAVIVVGLTYGGRCEHGVWRLPKGRCGVCSKEIGKERRSAEVSRFHEAEVVRIRTGLASHRDKVRLLNPFAFEETIGELYRAMGFRVEVTRKTGDGGKDLVVQKGADSAFIECKLHDQRPVGRPVLQKLVGALPSDGTVRGVVVTNSTFSQGAIQYAKERSVELVDGRRLSLLHAQFMGGTEITDVRAMCAGCGTILSFPVDPTTRPRATCECGEAVVHPIVTVQRFEEMMRGPLGRHFPKIFRRPKI